MSGRYSEGVCMDGAAILFDGVPVPVDEIVSRLNQTEQLQSELAAARERIRELGGGEGLG